MRILAMPAYFWPKTGGIETITRALAKEWVSHGHEVFVLTSRGKAKSREIIDGIKVIRTGTLAVMGCPLAPAAIIQILKIKPDIVYLHYPHPLFLEMGVFGSLVAGVPYVLHTHGPEITYENWRNMPISMYNKTFFRFALEHAAAIISHTEKAVRASPLLLSFKEKIITIPHGTELPAERKMATHGKTVLFMGMLREYKRVDLLLRAFVFVSHQVKDARLIIVGDGPGRRELEQLTQELKLTPSVRFVGRVPEQEKWQHYHNADIFVLPSPTLMESFGTVALEAAACGKPVIVTGAGVSEVFTKEKMGVVVEPYNVQALAGSIIDLLLHPTKAKRIGAFAADVIMKKYTWQDRAQEYIDLFKKVQYGYRR